MLPPIRQPFIRWPYSPYPRVVPTVVIIPVKSFRLGKQRLAEAVDDDRRHSLGKALASHVAETVENVDLLPLLVTSDPEVAAWAMALGFPSLPDPGSGLDEAAATGVDWALQSRSRWIVLHSDLPLVREDDLLALELEGDAIAPSADGGTSAISASRPFSFAYGPGSFHRHLARLDDPSVIVSTGLLHDIDSPTDLEAALAHPRGRWLGELLA